MWLSLQVEHDVMLMGHDVNVEAMEDDGDVSHDDDMASSITAVLDSCILSVAISRQSLKR